MVNAPLHPVPDPAKPLLSVVVPVRNEAENIAPLVAEIRAALAVLAAQGHAGEIVYVDDGSTDGTAAALKAVAGPDLKVRRHRASCGQSAAIVSGVRSARGKFIATLDGDGQNDPADIPRLLDRALATHGTVLVAGHRVNRQDSANKKRASRWANRIRARLLGDDTPDTGCGLKVFARAKFLEIPHFDHMHRYLPALFLRAGSGVESVPVNHRPRLRGVSNYGVWDRALVGITDMLGVMWLQRRGKRPDYADTP
jgi:dolichol-phosphate mannosyltransferase